MRRGQLSRQRTLRSPRACKVMERAGSRAVAILNHARILQMACELEENVRDSDAWKTEHCDETKMAAEKLFSYLDGDPNKIAVRS
jgi:hypothetical protein